MRRHVVLEHSRVGVAAMAGPADEMTLAELGRQSRAADIARQARARVRASAAAISAAKAAAPAAAALPKVMISNHWTGTMYQNNFFLRKNTQKYDMSDTQNI